MLQIFISYWSSLTYVGVAINFIPSKMRKSPDHAIFFTGVDICVGPYHPECSTLGYANVGQVRNQI